MCRKVDLPGGGFAIVCGGHARGPKRYCADCIAAGTKAEAVALCDGPAPAPKPGQAKRKTCDRGMCAKHVARRFGRKDFCSRCAPSAQGALPLEEARS